jgi:methionyl-tRNA formyltransferase
VAARPRIALLTLPSVMSDEAALRFLAQQAGRVVLVGLSDPMRPAAGGPLGQLRRHLARSGPRILPYLALGFGIPGRGRAFRRAAAALGAAFAVVRDVNGPDFAAALAAAGAELAVTFHFDQILAAETIARLPLGGINLHPALLPRHRGPVPAFWALAEGGEATGVSLHRLAPRIDAGDLLVQARVPLPTGISALEAARRLHLAGLDLFPPVLEALAAGRTPAGTALPLLPYRPFPDAVALREAARRGVRLVRVADIPRSLVTMRNDTRGG